METNQSISLCSHLPKRNYAWAGFAILCVFLLLVAINSQALEPSHTLSNSELSEEQDRVVEHFMKAGNGVIFAFKDKISSATSSLMMEYYLQGPSYLPLTMMFYSLEAGQQEYYIFCLVDYKLTPCTSDDNKLLVRKIIYQEKTKSYEHFNIYFPSTGRHDVTIVGVNISSYSDQHKAPINNILYRATVVVGKDSPPTITYEEKSNDCDNQLISKYLESPKSNDGLEIFDIDSNSMCTILSNLNEKDINYAIVSLSITENKLNGTNIISTLNYIKVKSRQSAYFSIINSDTDTIDYKLNLAIENPFIRLEKPRGTVNQIKSSILISNILSSSDMKHLDVH